ncbi:MAG TPA: hypothetical protein VG454_09590 [Gemmatimonadales bacterium]|nr:hypothetical protein [Gemmatimonadales bacterium]
MPGGTGARAGRLVAAAALAAALLGCSSSQRYSRQGEDDVVTGRSIEEVLAAHTDSLMSLPGVVGTAIGLCDRGDRCIKVLLNDGSAEAKAKIPSRLEGYRVVTEIAGTIQPR